MEQKILGVGHSCIKRTMKNVFINVRADYMNLDHIFLNHLKTLTSSKAFVLADVKANPK